jgi:hypothetical protein
MRYTTAGQLWNIISPREFVDFSYTVAYEEGLLSCGNNLKTLYFLSVHLRFLGKIFLSVGDIVSTLIVITKFFLYKC